MSTTIRKQLFIGKGVPQKLLYPSQMLQTIPGPSVGISDTSPLTRGFGSIGWVPGSCPGGSTHPTAPNLTLAASCVCHRQRQATPSAEAVLCGTSEVSQALQHKPTIRGSSFCTTRIQPQTIHKQSMGHGTWILPTLGGFRCVKDQSKQIFHTHTFHVMVYVYIRKYTDFASATPMYNTYQLVLSGLVLQPLSMKKSKGHFVLCLPLK